MALMNSFAALLTAAVLAGATRPAAAQTPAQTAAEPTFKLTCQDYGNWSGGRNSKQACETRDLAFEVPAGQPLTIDGGANGGITVHGWAGPNVRVRAKVQSWGDTEAAAQTQLQAIKISSQNHSLRAEAPAGADRHDQHWAVSYEVFVPQQTALVLHTVNGGIGVDNVRADVRFDAVNGGVSLESLGGQVAGRTVNGGLNIRLSGPRWEGAGLDVETTNGGITWRLPTEYSARLFTSTNVGGISVSASGDLPITKSGLLHREVSTTLGQGGAPLKAVTTNGGISIKRAGL